MRAFESLLQELHSERTWVISPPQLIDYIESDDGGRVGRHVYGLALFFYSAFPPWNQKLSKAVDEKHLEESEIVIRRLSGLSGDLNCVFSVQLDSTYIGRIEGGDADSGVKQGLLEEWRRELEKS